MITAKKFEAEVRRLAAENPEYVYPRSGRPEGCVYVEEKTEGLVGSCLLGQALVNIGVDPEFFSGPSDGTWFLNSSGITHLADHFPWLTRHRELIEWAEVVQESQDAGAPWGEAVQNADEYVAGEAA